MKETSIEHQIWPNIYTELLMVNEENKKVYKTEQQNTHGIRKCKFNS